MGDGIRNQIDRGARTHTHTHTHTHTQNLLRLSYGSGAGMSPEATLQQSHSLPSSVSDALEAMVGGGLDDLTLEDIDTTSSNLTEEPSEVGGGAQCSR